MTHTNDLPQIISRWSGLLTGSVCYLPGLGPIYSDGKPMGEILSDILNNAAADSFLVFDKNRRWYEKKQEKIVVAEISSGQNWLCVPTINVAGDHVKFYFYSNQPFDATTLVPVTAAVERFGRGGGGKRFSIISFVRPRAEVKVRCCNIYLKIISAADKLLGRLPEITFYQEMDDKTKSSFAQLGQESDMNGFSFLSERLNQGNDLRSPIVCLVRDREVIGAIGPLDVWADAWGERFLLPPYFGVKEKFRGKDCGERLWKQAMSCAFERGARYTLVQNAPDSLAAQFYEKQGLVNAGQVFICALGQRICDYSIGL